MKRAPGFTLLELVFTIVIAGMLAAAALPNLAPLKARQDYNQGVALVEDSFRQAQDRAIRKGITVHLYFDPRQNSYWLCDSANCPPEVRIELPPLPNGVYLVETDFVNSRVLDLKGEPLPDNEVAFDYQGRVEDGGDILRRVVLAHQRFSFTPFEVYLASLSGSTWSIQREADANAKKSP
jgi:prepilin-type N-terminal cleavage/methylation domain-containing protein